MTRRTLAGSALIFVLALGVHASVGAQYRGDPFSSTPIADADSYRQWGQRLAARGLGEEAVFHQAPLFPVLLSVLYRLTPAGWHVAAEIVFQSVLVSLALALLVPLGRACFDSDAAGLAAGFLALLHGPNVFYAMKLLPQPLALATQAAALLALCLALRRPRFPVAAAGIAGALSGLAALARPEMLLFAGVAALILVTRGNGAAVGAARRTKVAAFLVALGVVLLPAAAHNLRRGDAVPIASSAGENLYAGNQPGGSGGHTAIHPQAGDLESQRRLARLLAEDDLGRDLRPSEVSAYWRRRAIAAVAADVPGWLALEARKIARLVRPDPTDLYSYVLERRDYLSTLWALPMTAAALGLLGLTGVFLAWRRHRVAARPALALLAVHTVVLLVFFVDTRLRLPWLYVLALFAGHAAARALVSLRERRHRGVVIAGGVLCALLLVPGNLGARPAPRDVIRLAAILSTQSRLDESLAALAPLLSGPQADPVALDQAGWVLQKKGDLAGAREHYRRALDRGLPPLRALQTRTRLADVHERLGEADLAAAQYDAAIAGGHGNAYTYYQRGRFRMEHGDSAGAATDLRRAVELDPGFAPARKALEQLTRRR